MTMSEGQHRDLRSAEGPDVTSRDRGPSPSRRPYTPPRVERVGRLEDAVLSPTPGQTESGLGVGWQS